MTETEPDTDIDVSTIAERLDTIDVSIPNNPPQATDYLRNITSGDSINHLKITYRETFDYVADEKTRVMLKTAYDAICKMEAWEWIRTIMETQNSNGLGTSFMLVSDDMIYRIYEEIDKTYGGHSGSSFAFTMRNMEAIAIYGEESYRIKYHVDKLPKSAWA